MSGICGIYNRNDNRILSMVNALRHRGPDEMETVRAGDHSLGICRVVGSGCSSLPLTYGFKYGARNIYALLDGQIYNTAGLAAELTERGFAVSSTNQEEIIAALYIRDGDDFARHLRGMFAIAVLDGDRLLLCRDVMGVKPLFYWTSGKSLCFASEMKAILPGLLAIPPVNRRFLEELMTFGFSSIPEQTIFEGIKQVPPGACAVFNNRLAFQRYGVSVPSFAVTGGCGTSANTNDNKYPELVEEVQRRVYQAVKKVWSHGWEEKGIYLSGGLDSSLLAVLATQFGSKRLRTYTLIDSNDYEDGHFARVVAEAINSEHYEFMVDNSDYLRELPHFVAHYENVVAGGVFDIHGGVAYHMLSRRIAQYERVAVSGEGADELFGGYPWTYTHPLGFADRIRRRASLLSISRDLENKIESLFPQPECEELYRSNIFDFLVGPGLANYHLWSVDRSCGAFGLEVRVPYVDLDLVEFALSLPVSYRVKDRGTKLILRDAAASIFSNYDIQSILTRPKLGMPAALSRSTPAIKTFIAEVTSGHQADHPYGDLLPTIEDRFMFNLFFLIFYRWQGRLPADFDLKEFALGGGFKHLYD